MLQVPVIKKTTERKLIYGPSLDSSIAQVTNVLNRERRMTSVDH